MARGGRGRGHAETREGIRGGVHQGLRGGAVADEPVVSRESSGSVPIPQTEPIVSEAGVGVGVATGVKIHQGAPPAPVLPRHPGVLPVSAASGHMELSYQICANTGM
ncbi:hypothetical protein GIB67_007528 [Kingdonia uniflora]|uniref:Uncharacterized protein n=1 Tax=Kingdonia uniflora TaxID=39325 RepID=A0A7J7LN47_9MAGN|nr:hypothetical protein GIB67_007528 [Kingdonia uniflora]